MALADHPDIGAETKRHVREISQQLGYRRLSMRTFGREEAGKKLERVGFLQIAGRADDQVHSPPLRSLARLAGEQGIRLEIREIEEAESGETGIRRAVQFASGVEGLVITGRASPKLLAALNGLKTPYVALGYVMSDPADPDPSAHLGHVVTHDETLAARTATRWLIAAGHRRIAFTCEQTPPGMSHSRWLSGYQLAHLDVGLPLDPALVTITGKLFWGAEETAERHLAMSDPPTAHVVPDVRIAHGLIQAYAARGATIRRKEIVIEGLPEVAKLFAMEGHVLAYCETDLLAQTLLSRLAQMSEHPEPQPTTLLVPFRIDNLA
jgi:DNA-binding LacI/PurR family transcriptional regulator